MHSGIGFSNEGVAGQTDKLLRQIPQNSIDFILDLPMRESPGTSFHYNDGDPHLLSAILKKVTRKPTDEWADEVLFSRINVTNLKWNRYPDGITFGGFGIETTPRELAKIGELILNDGKYKEQQIVSSYWTSEMTSSQVKNVGDYEFGYQWWIHKELQIPFMWGHGGQFVLLVPEKELKVVISSFPNTQGKYQIVADEIMPYLERIIDACE